MKKLILVSILGALSLAATAQTAPDAGTVTISGAEKVILLPSQHHKMWPDEYNAYKGAYSLSNGQTLSVFSRGSKMYAKLENQDRHEIVATASNVFVALDEKLKMRIDLHDDGNVSGELYMVVTPEHVAKGKGTGGQLMVLAFH
ncbi:hypothetical protein [Undibacterium sp.]|jgi:hypothetical protein|uniref:hypothetical protein n=1 Tax=Undibacterium sp. TaxID=1914977 RepID=UPI002D1BCA26|nr:hypothetical protein [Undibacterium sp.]HTD05446.1 hypothetical protein [Undibacterium sp.]